MGDKDFLFIANDRCLDFVNTRPVRQGTQVDLLASFADLVNWLVAAGTLDNAAARSIVSRWRGRRETERALERALVLRGELTIAANCLSVGKPVPPSAVANVNQWLAEPRHYSEIVMAAQGRQARQRWRFAVPLDLLSPLAEFARELLCEKSADLVRQCGNPDCVLYFYDTTKNHARRWCSMDACGNRLKVARFRARRK